jgi:hypothetical protein
MWERHDVLLLLLISHVLAAVIGWGFTKAQLGKENDDLTEQLKIILPICIGLLMTMPSFIVNYYIDGQVNKEVTREKEKLEKHRQTLDSEYEASIQSQKEELEKYRKALKEEFETSTQSYIYAQQELEYVSLIAQVMLSKSEGFSIEQIDLNKTMPAVIETIRAAQSPESKLLETNQSTLGRHLSIAVLLNKKGEETLERIARKALDKILHPADFDLDAVKYKNFFLDIYTYLRVWLVCSLIFNRPMPVTIIKQRYPKQGQPDKKAYIQALLYIKETIFKGSQINHLLYSDSNTEAVELSKTCIRGQLQILINEIGKF